ncbi:MULTISPECIES: hypothetical protein [Clostridium]|uniref:hypothetical protein n=1 Tax=Clostridium botulinum TaxID=1491 RepID=UPI0005BBBCCD|nr:hypothetical protein [Clostridium botulinum]MDU5116527.1 hypothetical protein [Clostridium botulinum]
MLLEAFEKITDEKYKIKSIHFMPFDEIYGLHKSKEEIEREGGVFIEEIPEPEKIKGKSSSRYWNPKTKKIFYEYEDIPDYEENTSKSKEEIQEERIEKLENDITILQNNSIEQKYNELMKGVK